MKIPLQTKAELFLALVALLWGLTFPFIRISLTELSSLNLLLVRSVIATVVFLPFIFLIKKNKKEFWEYFPFGIILGVLFFISYFSQSIGLETTPSGRSAFLTNLTIVFVPFLSPFFKKGFPTKHDIISALLALCGLFFLTNPTSRGSFSTGDLWTICCAFFYAVQIHVLQIAMSKKSNALLFAFWQMAFIAMASFACSPFSGGWTYSWNLSQKTIWCIIYLGVIGMSLTVWLQTRYQQYTSPERASIIYILEPLCASFFGYLILQETFSTKNFIGAALIIVAVLWFSIWKFIKKYFS